jgi:ribosome-associated heat shock protein Hsp15
LNCGNHSPAPAGRRLDQWLWFARFAKSRSLASRLCAGGAVTVNGLPARKANQVVRIGDLIALPQGAYFRTVRIVALGARRGPAAEAQLLYEETAPPVHRSDPPPAWTPLLIDNEH